MILRTLGTLRWQILVTLLAVAAGFAYTGDAAGGLTVLLLGVFEISLSFDNAVVNAVVLERMSPFWQRMFLLVGVPVAAVGMRFLFPIVITSVAGGLGFTTVIDLALHHPTEYQQRLEGAQIDINTLGGCFLGLVFLSFFLDPEEGQATWLGVPERALARVGKLDTAAVGIVLVGLLVDSRLVPADRQSGMLISGLVAIAIFVFVNGFSEVMGGAGDLAKAGFATFVYLEVLDASFSFDGVIGAFAITNRVILICLGLGIGALYIRTMTVYFVKHGVLQEFIYLGHGAHWAIGVLAAILFVNNSVSVPEIVTGLIGVAIILIAVFSSVRHRAAGGSHPALA
ncbi:MAG TPA: DUF475 domain-containing protein, partial [Candidatus Dormibacteraeota bacterium]|nr:DUF475 domain-containing protein [Candidatus Dormibacteraeota bacterium]